MGETLSQVAHMRELATTLRKFAAETDDPDYVAKLVRAAFELEITAGAKGALEGADTWRREAFFHPVDIIV